MPIVTDIKELRKPSKAVAKGPGSDQVLALLVAEMRAVHQKSMIMGLAAPQIGHKLRVIITKPRLHLEYVMVNPVISKTRGHQRTREGCLSFPGKVFEMERPKMIVVHCQDEHREPRRYRFEGKEAMVVCHEIDHLDGKVLPDLSATRHVAEEG